MDLKLIKNLLNMIAESDVSEVSIEEGDFKIKVKKQSEVPAYTPQPVFPPAGFAPVAPIEVTLPSPQAGQAAAAPASAPAAADAPKQSSNTTIIKSPIVGTFYKAPSPDSPAFAEVGKVVSKGDTLCIIEAMKIMNEIESEYSGKIVRIIAENGQPVEFDQPLFEIEAS
jgi:acetyl-CoA carboxylase biotin carboxyl carrier protein